MSSGELDLGRELNAEDIAKLLPAELQKIVGGFWAVPSALGAVNLASLPDKWFARLQEMAIISTTSAKDLWLEAVEAEDHEGVERLEAVVEGPDGFNGDSGEAVAWTDLGLEVSRVCSQLWPAPPST